jgi:hypothetical protein
MIEMTPDGLSTPRANEGFGGLISKGCNWLGAIPGDGLL